MSRKSDNSTEQEIVKPAESHLMTDSEEPVNDKKTSSPLQLLEEIKIQHLSQFIFTFV
jgi:hypothetical protein